MFFCSFNCGDRFCKSQKLELAFFYFFYCTLEVGPLFIFTRFSFDFRWIIFRYITVVLDCYNHTPKLASVVMQIYGTVDQLPRTVPNYKPTFVNSPRLGRRPNGLPSHHIKSKLFFFFFANEEFCLKHVHALIAHVLFLYIFRCSIQLPRKCEITSTMKPLSRRYPHTPLVAQHVENYDPVVADKVRTAGRSLSCPASGASLLPSTTLGRLDSL